MLRKYYLDILLRHFDKDSHPPPSPRWATLIFMGNLNRASSVDLKEATLRNRGKPKWVALKCLNWKPNKYFQIYGKIRKERIKLVALHRFPGDTSGAAKMQLLSAFVFQLRWECGCSTDWRAKLFFGFATIAQTLTPTLLHILCLVTMTQRIPG